MGSSINQVRADSQAISVCYDMSKFEMSVDVFEGPVCDKHKTYKKRFSRYRCFTGIEKAPDGPFDPDLLVFESISGDRGNIGVRVGEEFYPGLPCGKVEGATCSYSVRPGVEGTPVSTGQILAFYITAVSGSKTPDPMARENVVIDRGREAVPEVPEPEEKKPPAAAPRKTGKVRRLLVAPADVIKEGKRLLLWACWLKMYRQLYRRSKCGNLQDMPHYPRETTRKGRYYFCGNAYLARICGLDERTVKRVLHKLEDAKLIYIRYKGYKGRGCSIIELPVNKKLVWRWRREHGGKKTTT